MRGLVRLALADDVGFDGELSNFCFPAPFKPLVQRWDALSAACDAAGDEAKAVAVELIDFLHPILAPSIEGLAKTAETGTVTFDNI